MITAEFIKEKANKKTEEEKRAEALAKLSLEDRQILGLS